jgi:hypothetical protein
MGDHQRILTVGFFAFCFGSSSATRNEIYLSLELTEFLLEVLALSDNRELA